MIARSRWTDTERRSFALAADVIEGAAYSLDTSAIEARAISWCVRLLRRLADGDGVRPAEGSR